MNLNELTYGVDLHNFPEDCRVICVCAHGLRSSRAAQYLRMKDIEA